MDIQIKSKEVIVLAALVNSLVWFSPTLAQPTLSVSVGVNAPLTANSFREEELFRNYWPLGFNVGAMGRIPVTPWMLLDPSFAYKIYPFQGVQDYTLTGDPFISSSGEPIQQLFLGLGLRLHDSDVNNSITPYLDVDGGYEVEQVGKVTLQWQERSTGSLYTTERSPEYRHEWAFTMGIGIVARLSSRFALQPAFLWHGSGKDRNYALAALDLVYTLPL